MRILLIPIIFLCAICTNAQTGVWSGKLDVQGTKLSLVFDLNDNQPTMDSPDQGVNGIAAQVERGVAGKIIIKVPSLAISYDGQWLGNIIVGTFKQMNVSLPLTLTPGENKPKRPQTPVGPFSYATEEVSFSNGDYILNGTLTLPEGYSRKTPVLLMVTGSGQQNRDEEIFEHKPFAVIADALARVGVATLRYDDRGIGDSSAKSMQWTTEDFKTDALSGLELLRDRFDKVGVLGHSEGGTIAMMIAAENKADFIVSLAGMAISGAETLMWQNRIVLKGLGFTEEQVDSYCKMLEKAFEAKANVGSMPEPDDYDIPESLKQNYRAVVTQIQMPYLDYFLSLDARSILGNVKCPVLALNGTKDIQVDYESNLSAIREYLPANSKNYIETIDGVNHLFQHCETGQVTEYRTIEETIAPEVLEIISNWMSDFK